MSNERQVYLLDPGQLPPETIAVTFAKTSHVHPNPSKKSPRTNRRKKQPIPRKMGGQLWSFLGLLSTQCCTSPLKNISRLAVEALESNRWLPTQKNPAVTKPGDFGFPYPQELRDHPRKEIYTQTGQKAV
jgi:hypothetical protein